MRYRRLGYRYAKVISSIGLKPFRNLKNLSLLTLSEPQWQPAADLYETPTALIVKAELAGMKEEDFDITLYHDALVIEGMRSWESPDKPMQFHAVEIHYGPFRLEIPLSIAIDKEAVEARYELGFLYVTLPKAEEELS
ncbi:heat-shock protein Hsp20 [Nostoc sp. T09]|uniref:Hsp20/alpha crystallin family protein n=1 Tax=Nostoc sp. T09 TaxID=1932621 RepID=UPI000A3716CC|nr:Hsp20/alpha crystallin family protein [Nostoc sp. T09]OUL17889.1 heat-shock protein Hsp20 [Nostoc sp. T09]